MAAEVVAAALGTAIGLKGLGMILNGPQAKNRADFAASAAGTYLAFEALSGLKP